MMPRPTRISNLPEKQTTPRLASGKLGKKTRLSVELARAQRAALRLYRNYPNVVGISAGTKFTKRTATDEHAAIHFYVRKKISAKFIRRRSTCLLTRRKMLARSSRCRT